MQQTQQIAMQQAQQIAMQQTQQPGQCMPIRNNLQGWGVLHTADASATHPCAVHKADSLQDTRH